MFPLPRWAEYPTLLQQRAGALDFPSPLMGEGQGEGAAPQASPLPLAPSHQGREEKCKPTRGEGTYRNIVEKDM